MGQSDRMRSWENVFFFQAEDGIRDLVRSRGLGDVYKRQVVEVALEVEQEGLDGGAHVAEGGVVPDIGHCPVPVSYTHLTLPTIYSV